MLAVFARGMLLHHYTRIYFEDEAANASDPVLALVPADRRATLIAKRKPSSGNVVYTLDVHLQNGGRRRPEGDTPQERVRMTEVVEQMKESSSFKRYGLSTSRRRPFCFWLQMKRTISPKASCRSPAMISDKDCGQPVDESGERHESPLYHYRCNYRIASN